MTQTTNWLWGSLALLAGAAIGFWLVFSGKRSQTPEIIGEFDSTEDALEKKYQALLGQIRELEADKEKHAEEDYQKTRLHLEREAAAVLREKDRRKSTKAPATVSIPATSPTKVKSPALLRPLLWVAGTVGFGGLLIYFLGQDATPKEPPMAPPQAQAMTAEQTRFNELLKRLDEEPENIELRVQATDEFIRREMFQEAQALSDSVAGLNPFHLENRIHRALLLAASGQTEKGLGQLEHLANQYPQAQEALLFAGALLMEKGNKTSAIGYFERFLAETPSHQHPPGLQAAIESLKQSGEDEARLAK